MTDYINRQAAIATAISGRVRTLPTTEDGENWIRVNEVRDSLLSLPSAYVQPVRHGHWQITDGFPHNVYCSECHKRFAQTHWIVWEDGSLPRRYCPHCGARMDGSKEEEIPIFGRQIDADELYELFDGGEEAQDEKN